MGTAMGWGLNVEVLERGADLRVSGRLDALSAPLARARLHDALDAGDGDLVLRLADLEIRDSTGLAVLVGAARRARSTGRTLVLADVPDRELRLLRVARVQLTGAVRTAELAVR